MGTSEIVLCVLLSCMSLSTYDIIFVALLSATVRCLQQCSHVNPTVHFLYFTDVRVSLWTVYVLNVLPWKFNNALNLALLSNFMSPTIEMCLGIPVKYPSFLPDFNQILMFLEDFYKIL
jgi:hypothetical protein